MKALCALLTLIALGACASSGAAGRTDWRCDGGSAYSVRMRGANAEVFAGGRTYTLPGVAAGSGTRYTDGSVEYWEHGGEAMLNNAFGGPYENCRRG